MAAGTAKNPLGTGRDADQAPNIENPRRPFPFVNAAAEPAGFGPIDGTWEQRRSLLGTYGDDWLKERWPWFPDDFDPAYFNAAPRDQQRDGFFIGDEAVAFQNLHPGHALYRSALPASRARCFVNERAATGELLFKEVPLGLDTVWIDADDEKLVLVWRGQLDVRSLKIREIENVFVGTEPIGEPRSGVHYRDLMAALQVEKEDPLEREADAARTARDAAFDEDIAALRAHFDALDSEHDLIAADAAAEEARISASHFERMQKEGIDPQLWVALTTADGLPPGPALTAALKAFPEEAGLPAALAAEIAAAVTEADEAATERNDFDNEFPEEERPLTRESVIAIVTRGEGLAGRILSGLDLSELDLSGIDFSGARLDAANLAGGILHAANFSGADLRKTDLSRADLSNARLDEADLNGARLTGATLTASSLAGAALCKLELAGLDFSACTGGGVDFSGSDLRRADFSAAKLPRANFQRAQLDDTSFRGAELRAAQLEGAHAHRADFEGADISGVHAGEGCDLTAGRLCRVRGAGAIFEQAVLVAADFSRAQLQKAQFGEALMLNANFDRADMSGATFDDADLRKATLTNANFLRAAFDRADLTGAALRGSNCYEAGFWDAIVHRADLSGANLKGTLLG